MKDANQAAVMIFLGLILGFVLSLTFNVQEIKKAVQHCTADSAGEGHGSDR